MGKRQKPEENTFKEEAFQIWNKNQLSLRVGRVIGFDTGLGMFNICLRSPWSL